MTLPTSPASAKAVGSLRYFTGKPCRYGHVSERQTSSKKCLECHRLNALAAKRRDPKKRVDYIRQWRAGRPDYGKNWYSSNREKERERERLRRQCPQHQRNAANRQKRYRDRNPDVAIEHALLRQRALLRRIPAWADRQSIRAIYKEARRLSAETGVKHNVDHIIPLRGATVSGLHVAENLRIITAEENRRKANSYSPEMLAA